MTLILEVEETP